MYTAHIHVRTQHIGKRILSILSFYCTKLLVGLDCVHWTYSSSSSSAISEVEAVPYKHSRSSTLSVVGLARFLVNHGGLFK